MLAAARDEMADLAQRAVEGDPRAQIEVSFAVAGVVNTLRSLFGRGADILRRRRSGGSTARPSGSSADPEPGTAPEGGGSGSGRPPGDTVEAPDKPGAPGSGRTGGPRGPTRRTPSDWTPEEAARRVDELSQEGHGPQRHEGQVTPEQHARRVLDGVDPATGSARDFAHGGQHRAPRTSSSFTSNEAYAQAESAVRSSPAFDARAAAGGEWFRVEMPLSEALGQSYRNHVFGVTKMDPRATLNTVDFTGGNVVAYYRRNASGGYRLDTMYAEPR